MAKPIRHVGLPYILTFIEEKARPDRDGDVRDVRKVYRKVHSYKPNDFEDRFVVLGTITRHNHQFYCDHESYPHVTWGDAVKWLEDVHVHQSPWDAVDS